MHEAELTVKSIAAGGDGVARDGELVVFVPRTAPGDRALVRYNVRGSFARGRLVRLIEASPHRQEPVCVHYIRDSCGGCQLQHLDYATQLREKGAIVRDALQRIGGSDVSEVTVEPSPLEFGYRRKLTLVIRRTASGHLAGLHKLGSPEVVFRVEECPVSEPVVVAAWREIMEQSSLLPQARELRGSVVSAGGKRQLVLEGGVEWPLMNRMLLACRSLDGIAWVSDSGKRSSVSRESRSGFEAFSFLQVNDEVARSLRAYVKGLVMAGGSEEVVYAYSGSGELALELEKLGVRVLAIEAESAAVESLRSRIGEGSRVVLARVEDVLPELVSRPTVVVNPPRDGLDARVAAAIEARDHGAVNSLIYVSCNPATLARDLKRMPSFAVAEVRAFDMFPQTAHVETVCRMERTAA